MAWFQIGWVMQFKYGVVIGTFGDEIWETRARFAASSAETAGADQIVLQHDIDLATARNAGAAKLDTEFVTFLDADDYLEEGFFDNLDKYTDPNRSSLYKPQTLGLYPNGDFDATPCFIRPNVPLTRSNSLVIGTTMRLVDFRSTTGFDPTLEALEDWDLFLRLYRNGADIVECEGVIYIVSVGLSGRNSDKTKHHNAYRLIRRRYGLS